MLKKPHTFIKKTIRDIEPRGKVVLVRVDYNVPLTSEGTIADDFKMRASLPTLRYLHERGAKIVVISHLGRPDGVRDERYSLRQIAVRLEGLMKHRVLFVPECAGDLVKQSIKRAGPHSITVLENLRFHPEEEQDDEAFAKSIAVSTGARFFVQDGFGVVHRAHASTDAITHYIPSVSGLLLEREYTQIINAVTAPKRPLIAILGGAKVSDKVPVIERLVDLADTIVIGGAMANTFLAYKGFKMGSSKVESIDPIISTLYHKAARKVGAENIDHFIQLPSDVVVGHSTDDPSPTVVNVSHLEQGEMALDIGPVTAERYAGELGRAHTVLWNGTLGYAEHRVYRAGSERVAKAVVENTSASSIVGGGDTADFAMTYMETHPQDGRFTHVSTGGGASLELMGGASLPGITALLDA